MINVENWDRIRERLNAWWNHELDRPVIQAFGRRAGVSSDDVVPAHFPLWGFMEMHPQAEEVPALFQKWASQMYFGGEAFPNLRLNLGPGTIAAYLSGYCSYRPEQHTVWFEKPLSWDEIEGLEFQENNVWWQYTLRATKAAANACDGDYITGMTTFGGILDVLASLRGTQQLLMDVVDEPERVNAMRRKIQDIWHRCYSRQYEMLQSAQTGSSHWMGFWSPGKYYPIESDFSAMISPRLFEEMILPELVEQARFLDHSIYHLDGEGELPHLDMLLEVPEIDGIQWIPDPKNEYCESLRWVEMYRKILAKGKLLVLQRIQDPWKIPELLRHIPGEGVLIHHYFASEEEAREFVKLIRGQ